MIGSRDGRTLSDAADDALLRPSLDRIERLPRQGPRHRDLGGARAVARVVGVSPRAAHAVLSTLLPDGAVRGRGPGLRRRVVPVPRAPQGPPRQLRLSRLPRRARRHLCARFSAGPRHAPELPARDVLERPRVAARDECRRLPRTATRPGGRGGSGRRHDLWPRHRAGPDGPSALRGHHGPGDGQSRAAA